MIQDRNHAVNGAEPKLPRAVFWDMDGTLIDSEPIWHEAEIWYAERHGGEWSDEMGWKITGTPVPKVAQMMINRGTKMNVEELTQGLIDFVAAREIERMPWIPGGVELVKACADAGIPNVLVTASPRKMAEALLAQAPEGAFVGFVCGDDVKEKKPHPAPYLAAAKVVGIDPHSEPMKECVAVEDSETGLQSAVASGATTIAITGYMRSQPKNGPQFASIKYYEGMTPETLGDFVRRRLGV
ncbi:haloacid dehalogenase [Bifidobacterium margollesii]|uniref:Haloacid dehalogenase n=1 Tax=Bifidobacterium margollesii TaxID=2020964 RepID=A0A2N5JD83_9BIFI|nr:HAD family phosphatase [Bifidobacterium margollesii]PLS32151.1 haloacid dehalogenase [Bifidobacterium margollesii]